MFAFLEFGSPLSVSPYRGLRSSAAGEKRQGGTELRLGDFADKLTRWPLAIGCCLSFPVSKKTLTMPTSKILCED